MMKHIRRPLAATMAAVMFLWTSLPALADSGDQMGFTTYYFSDSGDNSVITTAFKLAKRVLSQTVFLFDIELDNVTVPPVTAVTGATRPQRRANEPFEKSRGQVIVGIEQGLGGNATVAGNFYRSQEVDYTSNSVIGALSTELFEKNTTVTVRGQLNADKVGKILDDGEIVNRDKKAYSGALSISQILSPTTVMDLTYDLVYVTGFQSDPYRMVNVFQSNGQSQLADELHPSTRVRHAGTLRLSQLIPTVQLALIGSYRYYRDDWAVQSHTAEMKLNKYVFHDLVFGVNYRYYTQSGAHFYSERYVGTEFLTAALRTSDYKLKPFGSNNFGLSLTYLMRGLVQFSPDLEFLQNSSIELMYFRYFNNLDFSADIIQTSLKFSI